MKERTRRRPIVASTQLEANKLALVATEDLVGGGPVAPYYENRISLPDYLEQIARDMRQGDFSPVSEACLLFKDMANEDPAIITVLRWGEPDGLMDTETVAALGGRVGPVQ
jgi:hypothetical protein